MRMEQYLTHTDYALWEVIVNGDAPAATTSATGGVDAAIPLKTTEQKIARRNELKAKSTLLLAIPDDHLLKFHGIKDKTILKQQYKNFAASRSEGLDKTYDKFQKLISQLEIHSEVISQEDANLKLLRSLPPAWNTHTSIMRNKSDLDTLSMADLYNTLKSYQAEEGPTDFALMAFLSSGSSSLDTEVRDNSIIELKNQLEESLKEKDDLKLKLENQMNERDLNNKSSVFESASDNSVNESEEDNNQTNDKYKAGKGYHAVPPPYTGSFMPLRPDLCFEGLDDSIFKSAIREIVTSVHETETSTSKTSKESIEKPKTIRSSAPIIEDWESNSDDDCEIRPLIEQNKPSHAKINFVK
nr:hypothetical protein [Tanacetum cinerariifolium]